MTVPRSFTHWTRLEPRPRNDELTDALRAQIRDPLWLLSRQWQFEEFHGDDAGSPVRADGRVEHDPIQRYGLGPRDRANDGGPWKYAGGPLEALVEREPVLTAEDDPPARLAAEAGQYFLRLLSAHGYETGEGPYTAEDFPAALRLSDVEGDLDAEGRAFDRVMTGRVLDGQAVFDAIAAAVSNLAAVADGATPDVSDVNALPLPTDGRRTEAFDGAVEEFVGYYRSLFDEPDVEATSAWQPERMEYEFTVATGEGDDETMFTAPSYGGGHLDWYAFAIDEDRMLDGDSAHGRVGDRGDDGNGERGDDRNGDRDEDDPASATTVRTTPTRATFPGMPATRWWEFEDAAVTLDDVAGAGANLPRLLLLEFAVQYGNDWFLVPVETPVGSFSRVTSLSITDSFGCSQSIEPTVDQTDEWSAFAFEDVPSADEPGLFVPPTLPSSVESDPVERVVLARDELANLGWGIERLVEGPVGDPLDRDEFESPSLRVAAVSPAHDDDVATEFVDLENPGDDDLDLAGLSVRRDTAGEETTVFVFDDAVLPPASTLRLHTGGPAGTSASDDRLDRYCERDSPIWADADALAVDDESVDGPRRVVFHRLRRPADAEAAYRLSSTVPNHWFPLVVDPTSPTDYRLARARLLDAEELSVDPALLPAPRGEILAPDPALLEAGADTLQLPEEEVTRSGTTVTRGYRLSSWNTGRAHLWAGRRARTGHGEASSDLRFDVLEDPTDLEIFDPDGSGDQDEGADRDDDDPGDGDDSDGRDDSDHGDDSDSDGGGDEHEQPRQVAVGLGEDALAALAYLLGWLSGIVVLFVGRENEYVRYHAAQSVVAFGTLFAAWLLLEIAQVLVFVLYYPAYPAGVYYPGGPSDPTTYLVLSWILDQFTLVLWLLVAVLWLYLVIWSALGRDPLVPGAARPARALARRVSSNR
ncbi:hypothetical protein [Natrinema gelatinilyticum]|uniref:hypothetical protein n=1 Tax=Natrinema gelatinilyticum TaxID=2961571 RepID=UPI0020C44E94|nr:hypothetical protein [Natrinema gelatinilyticum]